MLLIQTQWKTYSSNCTLFQDLVSKGFSSFQMDKIILCNSDVNII